MEEVSESREIIRQIKDDMKLLMQGKKDRFVHGCPPAGLEWSGPWFVFLVHFFVQILSRFLVPYFTVTGDIIMVLGMNYGKKGLCRYYN